MASARMCTVLISYTRSNDTLSNFIRDQVFTFVPNIHSVSPSMCFLLPNLNSTVSLTPTKEGVQRNRCWNRNRLWQIANYHRRGGFRYRALSAHLHTASPGRQRGQTVFFLYVQRQCGSGFSEVTESVFETCMPKSVSSLLHILRLLF